MALEHMGKININDDEDDNDNTTTTTTTTINNNINNINLSGGKKQSNRKSSNCVSPTIVYSLLVAAILASSSSSSSSLIHSSLPPLPPPPPPSSSSSSMQVDDCPDGCQCTKDAIDCSSRQFTDLPRVLPRMATWLNFAGNSLIILSSGSLSAFRNAIGLDLSRNELEMLADGVFEACPSLQILDLSKNNLSQVSEFTFSGIRGLKKLDLSANLLGHVDGAFVGLPELSRLDLGQNKLSGLTQFTLRDLQNLRYLVLSRNLVSAVDRKAFRMNEKLTYLDLRGNPLSDDLRFQFHSTSLTYVDLSECNLRKLPRGLPVSIRYLQLRQNYISHLNRTTFKECPFLAILVLDMNHITDVEPGTFESMSHLKQLWLNDNDLEEIPSRLPQVLQRLLMRSNRIRRLSSARLSAPRLQSLYLSDNRISEIADFAVGPGTSVPRLKILDVSGNRISSVDPLVFSRPQFGAGMANSSLESLFLSRNPLHSLKRGCFVGLSSSLKTLHLAYIGGSLRLDAPIETVRDLGGLEHLSLKGSSHLAGHLLKERHFWSGLRRLRELDLSGIEFEYVGPDLITALPSLRLLRMSSSSWHCNSSVLWLRVWQDSVAKVIKSVNKTGSGGGGDETKRGEEREDGVQENYCFNPSYLRGRNLLSLSLKDFYEPDLSADLYALFGKEVEANLRKAVEGTPIERDGPARPHDPGSEAKGFETGRGTRGGSKSIDYYFEEEEELTDEYRSSKSSSSSSSTGKGATLAEVKKSESRAIKDQANAMETSTAVAMRRHSTTPNLTSTSSLEAMTFRSGQDSTYDPLHSRANQGRIKLHLLEKLDPHQQRNNDDDDDEITNNHHHHPHQYQQHHHHHHQQHRRRPLKGAANFTIFSGDTGDKSDRTIFYFTLLAAFTIVVLLVVFLVLVPVLLFFSFRRMRRNRVLKLCKGDKESNSVCCYVDGGGGGGGNGGGGGGNGGGGPTGFDLDMGNSFISTRNGSGTLIYVAKTTTAPATNQTIDDRHPLKIKFTKSNNSIDSFLKSMRIFSSRSQSQKRQQPQERQPSPSASVESREGDYCRFDPGMLSSLNGIKSEGPLRVYRWNDF